MFCFISPYKGTLWHYNSLWIIIVNQSSLWVTMARCLLLLLLYLPSLFLLASYGVMTSKRINPNKTKQTEVSCILQDIIFLLKFINIFCQFNLSNTYKCEVFWDLVEKNPYMYMYNKQKLKQHICNFTVKHPTSMKKQRQYC